MAETPIHIGHSDDTEWHSKDKVVTTDNIAAATARYNAQEAIANGTATQEQRQFIADCDADLQRILAESRAN